MSKCNKLKVNKTFFFCNLKRIKIEANECIKCNFEPLKLSECCRCLRDDLDILYTKNGKICFRCLKKSDLKQEGYWSEILFPERKSRKLKKRVR
jgi:hypothetical protein